MAARMLFGLGEDRRSGKSMPPSQPAGQSAQSRMVAAARAGDLRAWLEITRRYQESIFRSAWITSREVTAAEEVTRRTFTRAYRSLDSLGDDTAAVLPWLISISTTVWRGYVRELAQRRDAKSVDTLAFPRLPVTPLQVDPRLPRPARFEYEALASAFDRSSDHDRLIISSRYAFGLDRASAATRLGVAPDEIEKDLRASMRRLRDNVVESMAEPMRYAPTPAGVAVVAPAPPAGPSGPPPSRILSLPDDALGAMTMSSVLSGITWTPDVATTVCDGLAREAVTYPVGHEVRARGSDRQHDSSAVARAKAASVADAAATTTGSATRRRGWSSPRATALLVGSALLAFSFAAVAAGPGSSGDVGMRVAGLFGRANDAPSAADIPSGVVAGATTSVAVEPSQAAIEPDLIAAEETPLDMAIVGARTRRSGDVTARVRLDWERPAEKGTVVRTRLERRVDDGPWTTIERVDRAGPIRSVIRTGERYAFRLRSFDASGTPVVSPEAQFELVVRGPRSSRLARQGDGWVARPGPFGRRLIATEPSLGVTTAFTGSHVALVGPAGPDRGAIAVRIDAGPWVEDDLSARQRSERSILFSQGLEDRQHDLDIRAGASGLALDSILFLRSVSLPG